MKFKSSEGKHGGKKSLGVFFGCWGEGGIGRSFKNRMWRYKNSRKWVGKGTRGLWAHGKTQRRRFTLFLLTNGARERKATPNIFIPWIFVEYFGFHPAFVGYSSHSVFSTPTPPPHLLHPHPHSISSIPTSYFRAFLTCKYCFLFV
jgi:hypothetical protein